MQAEADMRRMGFTQEQIAAERRDRADAAQGDAGEDLVLPRHLFPALRLFAALRSQWRVAASAAGLLYLGLDYGAVRHTMWLMGLRLADRGTLFEQLRVMEREGRTVLNAQAVG